MSKRGRKPPIHDPIFCGGCHEPPKIRGDIVLPCACGAAWHFEVLDDARRPKWLDKVLEQ